MPLWASVASDQFRVYLVLLLQVSWDWLPIPPATLMWTSAIENRRMSRCFWIVVLRIIDWQLRKCVANLSPKSHLRFGPSSPANLLRKKRCRKQPSKDESINTTPSAIMGAEVEMLNVLKLYSWHYWNIYILFDTTLTNQNISLTYIPQSWSIESFFLN